MSSVTHLSCPRCDASYDANVPANVCTECGSPLLVEYDIGAVSRLADPDEIAEREPTMWRYLEFLPIDTEENIISLGEGFTPLIDAGWLGEQIGVPELIIKDEGLNPTGSFKARGASCGISRCLELGIEDVALPTAGNAGGAWAAYGASAGINVHIAMPSDAPAINRLEAELFGADVTMVDGLISDAGALIARGVAEHGWFDVSTLREPYRIEGKKTLGLEICEQLGWEFPDAVIYPAGGGVGLIGMWRAFIDLRDIGWVNGELPRLIAVQAAGCAPLVRAFETGAETTTFWEGASTIAAGLRVPKPLGDLLVLRAIRGTAGTAIAVTDDEIRAAMRTVARSTGVSASPEGAATYAACEALVKRGDLGAEDRVVLVNTGSALKYPEALRG